MTYAVEEPDDQTVKVIDYSKEMEMTDFEIAKALAEQETNIDYW